MSMNRLSPNRAPQHQTPLSAGGIVVGARHCEQDAHQKHDGHGEADPGQNLVEPHPDQHELRTAIGPLKLGRLKPGTYRKLGPDEISGGTFTISNNGSAGSVLTMAIIISISHPVRLLLGGVWDDVQGWWFALRRLLI